MLFPGDIINLVQLTLFLKEWVTNPLFHLMPGRPAFSFGKYRV